MFTEVDINSQSNVLLRVFYTSLFTLFLPYARLCKECLLTAGRNSLLRSPLTVDCPADAVTWAGQERRLKVQLHGYERTVNPQLDGEKQHSSSCFNHKAEFKILVKPQLYVMSTNVLTALLRVA